MILNRISHSVLVILTALAFLAGCSTPAPKQATDTPKEPPKATEVPQNNTPSELATTQPTPAVAVQAEQPKPVTSAETVPAKTAETPAAATSTGASTSPFATHDADANQIDAWQRIRNGFGMKDMNSKLITRFEHWYADRPDYVERMSERARRYLYFIVEEVEKRKMPMEIALLPMIESAFNPVANSSARASGIWQFIPSTGKNFGMEQNWWYDGRRDVINATKGALDYLQKLHDMFGSWELALAAYNAGENSVMRAQKRNRARKQPTDYAHLRLPKETRQYVPKLLAVKNIVSYPSSFGLVLADVPNKPYFSEVTTTKHIDVERAAEMAGITMEEFAALNPAHSRPVILQKQDEVILLPVENVSVFQANLEKTDQPLVSWQACPTKKGDELDEIAEKYGITTEKLRSVNGIHRSVKTSNGQTLLVPLNGEQPEAEFTAFNTHLPPTDYGLLNAIRHTVRRGDTLSGIARRYHVKLSSLKSWNRGVHILHPGQHILVAQPAATSSTAKVRRNIKRASIIRKNSTLASRL